MSKINFNLINIVLYILCFIAFQNVVHAIMHINSIPDIMYRSKLKPIDRKKIPLGRLNGALSEFWLTFIIVFSLYVLLENVFISANLNTRTIKLSSS